MRTGSSAARAADPLPAELEAEAETAITAPRTSVMRSGSDVRLKRITSVSLLSVVGGGGNCATSE